MPKSRFFCERHWRGAASESNPRTRMARATPANDANAGVVSFAKRPLERIRTDRRRAKMTCQGYLPVPPRAAQCRQADAGGVETAVDGEDLSGDVAGAIAAQEEDRFRQFLLEAVTIQRNGVVIVGADFRRVNLLRHRGLDRAGRHGVDANAERCQFDRELFGEMRKPGLAGAV